jgi:perosamine synthetase
MIPIFNTYISPAAKTQIGSVINSTFISEGETVKIFEQALSSTFGFHYVSTLNSGTAALHLALDLLDLQPDDEVIIPAQTFIATGLAVLYCKAKVVFCDINYQDGNMSVTDLKQKISPKTKAVMCVHWGGYPCDLQGIKTLCQEHNLVLIEDAAHALGASYQGIAIGNFSDLTCFSFQAIKHLTTGDGGAITTTRPEFQKKILDRRWFGIDRANAQLSELGERIYNVNSPGFKYHLNNYAAALGLANLEGYFDRLRKRTAIAGFYTQQLQSVGDIQLFEHQPDRQNAWWLFGFHVEKRLDFIRHMKACGITVSVIHQRIDRNAVFGGLRDLPNQKRFDETQIHIPIHDAIDHEKADFFVNAIRKGW